MPITNCTDEGVSVEIKKPGSAKPTPSPEEYLLGTATGAGAATLVCGLANGHPTTAAIGGLIAVASVAWTLARRRRSSPQRTGRPSTAGRSSSVQSVIGQKEPIGPHDILTTYSDFTNSEVWICRDEDGAFIARVDFNSSPINVYYDPSGPAMPWSSNPPVVITNVQIDILPSGSGYTVHLT